MTRKFNLEFDVNQVLYKCGQEWFYEAKEVDRRLSYFLVKPSFIICDVGGAKGIDALVIAKKGAFVIDLDINGFALKKAKEIAEKSKLGLRLSFIKASATNLPFRNECLDLVTCFSTLDHLPNKRSAYVAINEFSRVVRRRGYVAVTVPNKFFLIGTINMKIKSLTEPNLFLEHRFTPTELRRALTSSGLQPVIFDSEYPKSIGPGILDHFPKPLKKMPGNMILLSLLTKFFSWFTTTSFSRFTGPRMGYLSIRSRMKTVSP